VTYTGLAEGGDGDEDDGGVERAEGGIAEAEPVEVSRGERLDDEVRGADQSEEAVSVPAVLEVEGYASLVGVVGEPEEALFGVALVVEEGADVSGGVSAGLLDLDDVRSEVAEDATAEHSLFIGQVEYSVGFQSRWASVVIIHGCVAFVCQSTIVAP